MSADMHDAAGHLTVLGWTTFALYLIAALLSLLAAAAVRIHSPVVGNQWTSQKGRFWVWIGVILAMLGLNKPLNLQTMLIELGRRVAGSTNLSQHQTGLHLLFFLSIIVPVSAICGVLLLRYWSDAERFTRQLPLLAGGCALIYVYILIRITSIAGFDQILGFDLRRIHFVWLLESGGLALIIAQAIWDLGKQLQR